MIYYLLGILKNLLKYSHLGYLISLLIVAINKPVIEYVVLTNGKNVSNIMSKGIASTSS